MRILVGVAWATAVLGGFMLAARYETGAGSSRAAPQTLADASQHTDRSIGDRFELLIFLHPQCPCSRATIDELERIVDRCGDRLHTSVWFVADRKLGPAWTHGELWERAARVPGIELHDDVDAAKATSMGAETSGTVLLYTPDRKLAYSGGITRARGHAGDNAGEDAIVELVSGKSSSPRSGEVFGCRLRDALGASAP